MLLGLEVCKISPLADRLAGQQRASPGAVQRAQAHPELVVLTTTKIEGGGGKGRGFSLVSQQIAILHF